VKKSLRCDENIFDDLQMSFTLIVCHQAGPQQRGVLLGSTRAVVGWIQRTGGFCRRAKRERLIFDNAILDFVITTI
jgi:hypothetical protein